jgi:hypothetical protein
VHDEWVVQFPLHCRAANMQRFVQVHGSGGNYTDGTRRTYVLAYRNADAVARERALGFDHSHNTNFNWDKLASPALPLIFFVTLWSGTTTGLSTLRLQTRRALATHFFNSTTTTCLRCDRKHLFIINHVRGPGQTLRFRKRLFAHLDISLLHIPRDDVSAVVDRAHAASATSQLR